MDKQKTILEELRHRPVFTLQKMCLTKVITELCNNTKILDLIKICNLQKNVTLRLRARNGSEFAAIHAMADRLISQICKFVEIKKRLLELLWHISYKIVSWKSKYASHIENEFLELFYWTNRGRIDSVRTVRNIIGNTNISIRKRFVLACSVCLEKEIREMWKEMSNDDKTHFSVDDSDFSPLIQFWMQKLKGVDGVFEQYRQEAFICAVEMGLLEAFKYFIPISTDHLRNLRTLYCGTVKLVLKLRVNFFLEEDEYEILYISYFELNDANNNAYLVNLLNTSLVELSLLIHSSSHDFFLNLLEERLQSTTCRNVSSLLHVIFHYCHLEVNTDNEYSKLFVDVWKMTPTSIKNNVKESYETVVFLCVLIKDNFPFLLKRGAFKKIAELTSKAFKSRASLISFGFRRDKWEFLQFLIEEEIVTTTSLKLFRNDAFDILNIRKSNKFAWNNILKLVRKIRMKASLEKR